MSEKQKNTGLRRFDEPRISALQWLILLLAVICLLGLLSEARAETQGGLDTGSGELSSTSADLGVFLQPKSERRTKASEKAGIKPVN